MFCGRRPLKREKPQVKILLLHPEDGFQPFAAERWDLVVDLARAPLSCYKNWGESSRCPVLSLCDLAIEIDDLHATRIMLQAGMGKLADRFGIDWWNVLSLGVVPELQQLMLLRRLAERIDPGSHLHLSRPTPLGNMLAVLVSGQLVNRQLGFQRAWSAAARPVRAFSNLDRQQLLQVLFDKFDSQHRLRRRIARRVRSLDLPVVLLPSAYVNVSRTEVAYARLLPEQPFLLVHARKSGRLREMPPNVSAVSLDSFFASPDKSELKELLSAWKILRRHLITNTEEFRGASWILDRMPGLLGWGIPIRDAWRRVFERNNISACLCADDSNPYTRIPLILSRLRRLPSLSCHHGALDAWMAFKFDGVHTHLAQSQMEVDYLLNCCRVESENIVLGAPDSGPVPATNSDGNAAGWLAFFTEPYHSAGWRSTEVYRELLPRLWRLARRCGLQLVLKLHPFDSVRHIRKQLKRSLADEEAKSVKVIAGRLSPGQWQKIRFAVTVESTIALECSQRAIPVLLCAWLRDARFGYVSQFARYGFGRVLGSVEELDTIPHLLGNADSLPVRAAVPIGKARLAALLNAKTESRMSEAVAG